MGKCLAPLLHIWLDHRMVNVGRRGCGREISRRLQRSILTHTIDNWQLMLWQFEKDDVEKAILFVCLF